MLITQFNVTKYPTLRETKAHANEVLSAEPESLVDQYLHRRTGQKKLGGRTHFCPTHPKVARRVKNESKYRLIVV